MTPSANLSRWDPPPGDACSTVAPEWEQKWERMAREGNKAGQLVTLGRIFISSSIIEALQGNRNFEGKRLNCTLRVYSNGDMISLLPSSMDV